jgi:hypothetical protein
MPASRRIAAAILLAVSSALTAQASQNLSVHMPARKKAHKTAAAQEAAQQKAAPSAPLVPLTPAEMPAVPPTVVYRDGLLTITADNCVLGDVLRAVRAQTGAVIEVPANATERVALRLGPGSPREVLASLLNGSHFDYVLLGTQAEPNSLARVILMLKTLPGPDDLARSNQPAFAAPPANRPDPGSGDEDPDANSGDDAEAQDEPTEQPATTPATPENPDAPGVKTPEQLLRELQQQQQQLLQQQRQEPQPGQTPPDQD